MIQQQTQLVTTFSNHEHHGGDFESEFVRNLVNCNAIDIASGYFGTAILKKYVDDLVRIAKRGHCRILIGMVYHEGATSTQKNELEKLHKRLQDINEISGVYITQKNYHGKIYRVRGSDFDDIYVGSSNFSDSGFRTNYEFTATIRDENTRSRVIRFLDFIFSNECDFSKFLSEVDLSIKGNRTKIENKRILTLRQCLIPSQQFPTKLPKDILKISFRAEKQPNSSLNLFFDKGRKKKNGKYSPRHWHEVEITSTAQERNQSGYPIGRFFAFVNDDGLFYKIPMITASEKNKAITSKGNRTLLGVLIKEKLERLGILKRYERITQEVLDEYGKDYIILKKIGDFDYILEF